MEKVKPAFSVWGTLKSVNGLALLWNLVLILGGLVLLAFVLSNGFLPELDLSGAVSLLASVSLVSLFFIFVIFMLTTAGGWAMYSWFGKWDAKLRGQTSMLVALFAASAVYAALSIPGEAPRLIRIVSVVVFIAMTVSCLLFGAWRFKVARSNQGFGKELGLSAGALFIGVVLMTYNAMVFLQLYRAQPGSEDVAQWAGFGVWLIAQAVCMGLVASCNTLTARLQVSGALGTVGFFFLLILSNNPNFVMDRVAKALGIGALQDISLAVTGEGCQVLSVFSEGFLCTPELDVSVYVIEPVTLRSRFGKQVLIEYARPLDGSGDSNETIVFKAVMQAADVLGWQVRGVAGKMTAEERRER